MASTTATLNIHDQYSYQKWWHAQIGDPNNFQCTEVHGGCAFGKPVGATLQSCAAAFTTETTDAGGWFLNAVTVAWATKSAGPTAYPSPCTPPKPPASRPPRPWPP